MSLEEGQSIVRKDESYLLPTEKQVGSPSLRETLHKESERFMLYIF